MSTSAKQGSLTLALLPSVILYVVAVTLILLTRDGTSGILPYWQAFVLLAAFISLLSGFRQAYINDRSRLMYFIKQVIHWGALIGALWLWQTQSVTSGMGEAKYTLVLMYLLAVSSITAGLYLDFRTLFFGIYMGICAYLLTASANLAILAPIGKTLHVANPTTKPLTMIALMALVAFVLSTFFLLTQRGSVAAKRSR